MTIDDITSLNPKFWQLHNDPAVLLDGGALTLLTIQYNLCSGTIARYSKRRPELVALVEDLLQYRKQLRSAHLASTPSRSADINLCFISGQFMITELSHGLDIHNIETKATMLPSGEFVLHTPAPSAAKWIFPMSHYFIPGADTDELRFMPPTVPAGLPCVAVVFAKLIVDGEDRGHRPFVVPLNDGKQMCAGVESRYVPHLRFFEQDV